MRHAVRSTLLYLGGGVVVQRVLQLVAFVLVGSALGVEGGWQSEHQFSAGARSQRVTRILHFRGTAQSHSG